MKEKAPVAYKKIHSPKQKRRGGRRISPDLEEWKPAALTVVTSGVEWSRDL